MFSMFSAIACVFAILAIAHIRSGMRRDRGRKSATLLESGFVHVALYIWSFDLAYAIL